MRRIAALLACVALPGAALGQAIVAATPVDPVKSTGSTTPRYLAARFAERLNVKDYGAVMDGVTDDSGALAAAITAAAARFSAGAQAEVYVPAGTMLIGSGTAIPQMPKGSGVGGDGQTSSVIQLATTFCSTLFSWDGASLTSGHPGASIRDLDIEGNRAAGCNPIAVETLDTTDRLFIDNVQINNIPGRAFYAGALGTGTLASLRESHISNLRLWFDGASGLPAFEVYSDCSASCSSVGDPSNEIDILNMDVYSCYSCVVFRSNMAHSQMRNIRISKLRIEQGTIVGTSDLLQIGDSAKAGEEQDITISDSELLSPYTGFNALHLEGSSTCGIGCSPQNINFSGKISHSVSAGNGVQIDAANGLYLKSTSFNVPGSSTEISVGPLTVGGNTVMAGPLVFDVPTGLTWSVDATSASLIGRVNTNVTTTAGNAANTTTTFLMAGGGTTFTPKRSGTILLLWRASVTNPTVGDGCQIQPSWGSGAAPAVNATATGTILGIPVPTKSFASNGQVDVSGADFINGAVPGTTYWAQLQYAANVAGSCTVANQTVSAGELGAAP